MKEYDRQIKQLRAAKHLKLVKEARLALRKLGGFKLSTKNSYAEWWCKTEDDDTHTKTITHQIYLNPDDMNCAVAPNKGTYSVCETSSTLLSKAAVRAFKDDVLREYGKYNANKPTV